jgi:hypothetical protein
MEPILFQLIPELNEAIVKIAVSKCRHRDRQRAFPLKMIL